MSVPAANSLAALRRTLAFIEASTRPSQHAAEARLDHEPAIFGMAGGLMHGALHEIAAARESEIAAAVGFALTLAVCCTSRRAVLWIAEDMTRAENGAVYGPGLDALGLTPERLILVNAARCHDVLWAMEEALRCRTVGAVIGEVRNIDRTIDLTRTRRLSLAAGHGGALAMLVRATPGLEPSAAMTRWIVGAASSPSISHGVGPPRLHARLVRNRRGRPGSWILEWNSAKRRFDIAAEDRQSLAEEIADRPYRAAAAGA